MLFLIWIKRTFLIHRRKKRFINESVSTMSERDFLIPVMPSRPMTMLETSVLPEISILPDYASLCISVADQITTVVHRKPNAVLGLATGSTPLGVYELLIRRHQQGILDFSQVTCFNLDEYYPMLPASPHSYHSFMQTYLFNHVNCPRWFVPNGTSRSEEQTVEDRRGYEARIADAGGIDLQLLGIGRSGHIGFNEPGSGRDTRTRLVWLAAETREDATASFGGLENVPLRAVTMGIGTILDAATLVVMAAGRSKASVIHACLTGPITASLPASWVRTHPSVQFHLDASAAALLRQKA
jgi:glucosamine-6-phosphate deaminase